MDKVNNKKPIKTADEEFPKLIKHLRENVLPFMENKEEAEFMRRLNEWVIFEL